MRERMVRRGILLWGVAWLLAGCQGPEPSPGTDGDDGSEEAPSTVSSAVPDSIFVRSGACPFECCVYRDWVARSVIAVSAVEGEGTDTLFMLQPGDTFTAVTGHVHVTGIERVAVTRPIDVFSDSGTVELAVGDSLIVLDPVGEGSFNVWVEGEVFQTDAFWRPMPWDTARQGSGSSTGTYETEWWVQARNRSGQTGWFLNDDSIHLEGADGCA